MSDAIADYLDRAADLIDAAPLLARGIYEVRAADMGGHPDDARLCYCMVGAIRKVITYENDLLVGSRFYAFKAVANHLKLDVRRTQATDIDLMNWSDTHERAKEEVAQALRDTAMELRNK